MSHDDGGYGLSASGVYTRRDRPAEVASTYESAGCQTLAAMQERHFWYLGRHRFLLHSLRTMLRRYDKPGGGSAIDLGGGCGGWIHYLQRHAPGLLGEIALGDAALDGLRLAGELLPEQVRRYHIDLRDLNWNNRWDVAFLLDVLEHIPEDRVVLREIEQALRPGGLLFVTCPAFQWLWSYNDDLSGHERRYSRSDFRRLAAESGLQLVDCRYFMMFLGPALVLARWRTPKWINDDPAEIRRQWDRTQHVPREPLNQVLRGIFALETPLGHWLQFPWGTSILGVFRKPPEASAAPQNRRK
jgi:SAM-dependent methyltransferase